MPVDNNFHAQEVCSGTTYQYLLTKEGNFWVAKMRMIRSDGQSATEWDGPIGVGYTRERLPLAIRFVSKFPKAAATSTDPEIMEAVRRVAVTEDAKRAQEELRRKDEELKASRLTAYRAAVDAVDLTLNRGTFHQKKVNGEVLREVDAHLSGPWAIHKVTDSGKDLAWMVSHVPTGLRIHGWALRREAERLVRAILLTGVDGNVSSFTARHADLIKIRKAVEAQKTGEAPDWFIVPDVAVA